MKLSKTNRSYFNQLVKAEDGSFTSQNNLIKRLKSLKLETGKSGVSTVWHLKDLTLTILPNTKRKTDRQKIVDRELINFAQSILESEEISAPQ